MFPSASANRHEGEDAGRREHAGPPIARRKRSVPSGSGSGPRWSGRGGARGCVRLLGDGMLRRRYARAEAGQNRGPPPTVSVVLRSSTSGRAPSCSRRRRDPSLPSRGVSLAEDRANPITIVLADDHAVVRGGLRLLLDAEDGFEVVAEAGDVDAARCARARRTSPTCSCSTSTCPASRACRRSRSCRQASPETRDRRPHDAGRPGVRARRRCSAGARGYVLKEAADDELRQAVRARRRGRAPTSTRSWARAWRPSRPRRRAARRPHRARGRGAAADRARPHQHRDRRAALPQRAHRRVPPRAHPAEAAALARRAELVRYALDHGLSIGRPSRAPRRLRRRRDRHDAAHARAVGAGSRSRASPSGQLDPLAHAR